MKPKTFDSLLLRVSVVLSVVFIVVGTLLTIDASYVQDNVDRSNDLISDLERIEDLFNELGVDHRISMSNGSSSWESLRMEIRDELIALPIEGKFSALQDHIARSISHLNELDRSHRDLVADKGNASNQEFLRTSKAFSRQLDKMLFSLRNEHLSGGLDALATRWGYYQFLFVLACTLALLLAFLSKRQKELIEVADQRAEELRGTTKQLAETNIELRETMMSKEEKEMMLKEIHHRVKNNLQIIRSLIRFQSMKVSDPEIEELFNECVNRVSAMAVLHEQTYLSKDLANIDVAEYLNMLVNDLTSAYNINMHLDVRTDIRVETLGVDTLMPIGLLINEIISNSLKYAFKDRNHGTISVSMIPDDEGRLKLTVLDDGIGISDLRVWQEADTLGMELIKTLVDQLNGSVELEAKSGTSFDIRFPVAA